MSNKDPNRIAAIEKAIAEKYGKETVENPRSKWNEEKEGEYLEQMSQISSMLCKGLTYRKSLWLQYFL